MKPDKAKLLRMRGENDIIINLADETREDLHFVHKAQLKPLKQIFATEATSM
jgi:hypothetical protein